MSDHERAQYDDAAPENARRASIRNLTRFLRAPAVVAVFAVLAWGGLSKLNDSGEARRFVSELLVIDSPALVTLIGGAELLLALWVASGWRSARVLLIAAAAFAAFAATHAWGGAVVGEEVSCGCLQGSPAIESMTQTQWIALTAGLAVLAAFAAATSDSGAKQKGVQQ